MRKTGRTVCLVFVAIDVEFFSVPALGFLVVDCCGSLRGTRCRAACSHGLCRMRLAACRWLRRLRHRDSKPRRVKLAFEMAGRSGNIDAADGGWYMY